MQVESKSGILVTISGNFSTTDALVWQNSQSSVQPSDQNIGYTQQKDVLICQT